MVKCKIDFYHKPNNIPDYYDIITCCAFIMKNSYKSTLTYYEGLKDLVKVIEENNVYLYFYHDRTIEEPKHKNEDINKQIKTMWIPLLDKMKRSNKIFCIRYDFPDFKENDFYHFSTFGTLTRFLPLFDLPEYKKTRLVYCVDIDMKKISIFYMTIKLMKYMKKNKNISLYFRTHECYNLNFWMFIKKLNGITNFRIIANTFCSRKKYPYEYFTDFLNDILSNNNKELKEIVKINNNIHTEIKCCYKFCYGFDEYFLNKYILFDIVTNGDCFLLNTFFNLKFIFAYVIKIFMRETKNGSILNNDQKKLLKQIMPNYNFKETFLINYKNLEQDIDGEEFLKITKKLEKENKLHLLFITKLELDCLKRSDEIYKKYGNNRHLYSIIHYDSNLVLHKRWINSII